MSYSAARDLSISHSSHPKLGQKRVSQVGCTLLLSIEYEKGAQLYWLHVGNIVAEQRCERHGSRGVVKEKHSSKHVCEDCNLNLLQLELWQEPDATYTYGPKNEEFIVWTYPKKKSGVKEGLKKNSCGIAIGAVVDKLISATSMMMHSELPLLKTLSNVRFWFEKWVLLILKCIQLGREWNWTLINREKTSCWSCHSDVQDVLFHFPKMIHISVWQPETFF